MTKPVIVTRASKGAPLTAAEMDANFNNINDAVITVTGDTGSITNSLNESFQISGGVATTSKVVNDSLIIDLDNTAVTPGSYTTADITVDAQGRITSAASGSATVTPAGANTQLQYNNSGALGASSNLTFDGTNLKAPYLIATNSTGDEGGEMLLAKPATNSTIGGTGVTIDVWQNRLRIFEQGGDARGVYIDITAAGTGVGTNLLSGGGATDLDGLSDVVITSPSTNNVLFYNGSNWVNSPAANLTVDAASTATTASNATNTQQTQVSSGQIYVLGAPSTGSGLKTANFATSVFITPSNGVLTATRFAGALNGTVGATTPASGVFTSLQLTSVIEPPFALTYALTLSPNAANGSVQKVTLTGNTTISAFTTPIAGQSITIILVQDASGSRTLTSTFKFSGSKVLSTAANSIDIMTVYYDGVNYYASLAKGFA